MADRIYIPPQRTPVIPGKTKTESPKRPAGEGPGFQSILGQELSRQEGVRFSAHAQERLRSRNINLSAQDVEQLNQAVNKAAAKGASDSLILMKDLALVVSVKNRTVVTAVDGQNLRDNVFTNIDSAVII